MKRPYQRTVLGRDPHGMSRTPMYRIWGLIKQRCHNPRNAEFENYGARGIVMCDEWATRSQQARNRRDTHLFEHDGHAATLAEWSEITGISRSTLSMRIFSCGWPVAKTLSTPIQRGGRNR